MNFSDSDLQEVLSDLSPRRGIGWLEKYEEVEYEYVDIHDNDPEP